MRHLLWVCALASSASAAFGQQPDTTPPQPALERSHAADSLDLALRPDCLQPSADTARPPSASARSPEAASSAATDSLCLTRGRAIAEALARNPQLQVAA